MKCSFTKCSGFHAPTNKWHRVIPAQAVQMTALAEIHLRTIISFFFLLFLSILICVRCCNVMLFAVTVLSSGIQQKTSSTKLSIGEFFDKLTMASWHFHAKLIPPNATPSCMTFGGFTPNEDAFGSALNCQME